MFYIELVEELGELKQRPDAKAPASIEQEVEIADPALRKELAWMEGEVGKMEVRNVGNPNGLWQHALSPYSRSA